MAAVAASAGLFQHGLIPKFLEIKSRHVADALMTEMQNSESAIAAGFLQKAEVASEATWKIIISGMAQGGAAPEVDTTYKNENERDESDPTQFWLSRKTAPTIVSRRGKPYRRRNSKIN